jgi:hypothetical protein
MEYNSRGNPGRITSIPRKALQASKLMADMRLPTFRSRDPVSDYPRRIVADMLLMPALQIGNPV